MIYLLILQSDSGIQNNTQGINMVIYRTRTIVFDHQFLTDREESGKYTTLNEALLANFKCGQKRS